MNNFWYEMIRNLERTNTISYHEICDITYAFQIASGQGFAVGKTKGILDYLKKHGSLYVTDMQNEEGFLLKTNEDLADLYLSRDEYIDLRNNASFSEYFP